MIISVMNAKGGVGKTTTAIFTATAFANRGYAVRVIDLDRQGSAHEWAEDAMDANEPLQFKVDVSIPKQLAGIAKRASSDEVIIIDAPPGDVEAIEATIKVSDLVIIPSRANNADLTRVWDIDESLEDTRHAVLLTFIRKGTSAPKIIRNALDEEGMPRFNVEIPLREDIQLSYGYHPGPEMHGYDDLVNELLEMMK